jgi:hypothetical protein
MVAEADDITVLMASEEGLHVYVRKLEKFCEWSKMTVRPDKCKVLLRMFDQHSKMIKDPQLETPVQLTQVPVPVLAQDNCVKYLGMPLTLFKATARLAAVTGTMVEVLERLERLSSLPLHPAVKLYALKASLVPTLDYIVKCESTLGAKECQTIDQAVQKWLRLGRSCPNAYFYTRRRDGGLGIPRVEQ